LSGRAGKYGVHCRQECRVAHNAGQVMPVQGDPRQFAGGQIRTGDTAVRRDKQNRVGQDIDDTRLLGRFGGQLARVLPPDADHPVECPVQPVARNGSSRVGNAGGQRIHAPAQRIPEAGRAPGDQRSQHGRKHTGQQCVAERQGAGGDKQHQHGPGRNGTA
jgi:hypothetical protein